MMEMTQQASRSDEVLQLPSRQLPIFAYGSLRGEGMYEKTQNHSTSIGAFVVRGVVLGTGDKFPCADLTYDMEHVLVGEGVVLEDKTVDALNRIDAYEGVQEGYYERRIIFASSRGTTDVLTPMWIYLRGERLR